MDLATLLNKLHNILFDRDNLFLSKSHTTQDRKELEAILQACFMELKEKEKDILLLKNENSLLRRESISTRNKYSEELIKKANRSDWELRLLDLVERSKGLMNQIAYGGMAPLTTQEREKLQAWYKDTTETITAANTSLRGRR